MKINEILTEAVKQRLDPKCWKGKHKEGTKIKGGVRVNNCVPNESVEEDWSQKYKKSINCSHPKGFSQKAHCAGKKKHNEDITMEAVCPDCGMCQTHGSLNEIKKGQKDSNGYTKCWPGKHAEGTKKGKNGGPVRNCVPNESEELDEEFDLIESIINNLANRNQVDPEVIWEDLESLTDDELYVFAATMPIMEDWQKANKKDKTDGMSQKAVNSYRREHPGSKLKTAVTTKPSKLKKGSKASKRRKSYCSRSKGQMKMHSISCAKTPDKAICKARRRWNCE
jgi:hypothetical protein